MIDTGWKHALGFAGLVVALSGCSAPKTPPPFPIRLGPVAAAAPVPVPLPVPAKPTSGPAADKEYASLQKVAEAFRRFHADTGEWPIAATEWHWRSELQIDSLAMDVADTALFTRPANLKECGPQVSSPCWHGPYLPGKSLGDHALLDHWGHRRLLMLLRPMDGMGGGTRTAPDGLVVIWSAGPDGHDSFACSDGRCARDWNRVGKGLPSDAASDDVVIVVGAAR